jgi:O-antigen/teichoic acid export membrane protein
MLQALVAAVLGVILARAGLGLPGQYIALIVAAATMWTVLVLLSKRDIFGRRSSYQTVEYARWSARWPLALTAVSSRVNLMTDALTVALVLGTAPVAVLSITQRLVLTGTGFLNASVSASWAPLGHMLERGEIARFRERVSELVLLVVGGGLTLGALLAALTEPFVSLWVGRELFGGQVLVFATSLQATLFGFVLIFYWVIDVRGDAPRRLTVSLIGSAINIIASVILARRIGVVGVTLGTIIGYMTTDVWYGPHLFFIHYGLKHADLFRPLLRSVLSLILFLPVVAIVGVFGRGGGWPHVIAAAVLGGLAWLSLVIGVLLSTGQRRAALRRVVDLGSFLFRRGHAES